MRIDHELLRKLMLIGVILFGISHHAFGQVSVPPQSTSTPQKANLTWNYPSTGLPAGLVACTSSAQCVAKIYRFAGTATSADLSSQNWTLATTTTAQATSYTDSPGAGTWSYVVEAVMVSNGNNSAPSNIVVLTLTNPPVPAPPVLAGGAGF